MLDYTFSEEQDMFRESIREFCEKNIAPRVEEIEKNEEIPRDLIKKMAEFELLACTVDPEYGGAGFDAVTAGIAGEEIVRADPTGSTAVYFLVQAAWGYLFNKYGTEEAKKEILPKVCKGEHFLGIATTEPDVGSDLANMSTTIKPVKDGYIVNGAKNYISGVGEVEKYGGGHVTLARQTLDAGARGMTFFYLPLHKVEGISITTDKEMGREGISTGGFNIDNVKIPKHYLIGEENKGFYIVHEGYELARGIIACVCCSAALKSLENGIEYMKQRKAFGRAIARYEGLQFKLAKCYTQVEAGRHLAYKALWTYDREKEGKAARFQVSKEIAMAKYLCPLWALEAIDASMQWQGAFGYSRECDDQRAFRAIRSFTLAEGSTEIMQLIIARELLGKEYIAYK